MEDSKIIDLFLARNEDAIRHTADTYGRRLFTLADNILKNDQDAEESVNCNRTGAFLCWNERYSHI